MTRIEFRQLVRKNSKALAAGFGKGKGASVRITRTLMDMWDAGDETKRAEIEAIFLRMESRLDA